MKRVPGLVKNRLLDALPAGDRGLLAKGLSAYGMEHGDVLFEPGQDVTYVYFPGPGTIAALLINLHDGVTAEAAMIGQEGAIGGIISAGNKPAFTRGVVQIAGSAMRLPTRSWNRRSGAHPACATISRATRTAFWRRCCSPSPAMRCMNSMPVSPAGS